MARRATKPRRVVALRADFDLLGTLLLEAEGAAAAAIARERRITGELLEQLEATEGAVPLVDQLAARRRSRTSDSGGASRRRKSG